MTKADVLNLYSALNQLGSLSGVRFSYGVVKNLNHLKPEIEALQKALEPSKEYQEEFEPKRIALVEKFAKKDPAGKPLSQGNQYVMEDEKGFEKAYEVLKKANKELVEVRDKQLKDYQELLKTESTVTLHKIKLADIPGNITTAQMFNLSLIVDE